MEMKYLERQQETSATKERNKRGEKKEKLKN